MLQIEKENKKPAAFHPNKSSTMSNYHSLYSSSQMRYEKPMIGHAAVNRRKNLENIDFENARLY